MAAPFNVAGTMTLLAITGGAGSVKTVATPLSGRVGLKLFNETPAVARWGFSSAVDATHGFPFSSMSETSYLYWGDSIDIYVWAEQSGNIHIAEGS